MSDLIELIYAFGANPDHLVVWSEAKTPDTYSEPSSSQAPSADDVGAGVDTSSPAPAPPFRRFSSALSEVIEGGPRGLLAARKAFGAFTNWRPSTDSDRRIIDEIYAAHERRVTGAINDVECLAQVDTAIRGAA